MVRRDAAVYIAFFLVVAAGSYSILALAEKPTATMENPAHTLSTGTNFTVDGQAYNLTSVTAEINSDGELVRSAEATWINQSAAYTELWQNNSTLSIGNVTYRVSMPTESDPSSATLREIQNVSQPTVTQNGTEYVVVTSNGTKSLVPLAEYKRQQFGAPKTQRLSEGDTFRYANNSTTIGNITRDSLPIQWTAPRTNTVEFGSTTAIKTTLVRGGFPRNLMFAAGGSNVTLNGQTYTVHYPDNETLQLSTDVQDYQTQLGEIRDRTERFAGLWAVTIISSLAALLVIALAFLPAKS